VQKFIDVVSGGGIAVYPTDTVYGIGCTVFNEKAVRRIFEIKGRTRKPLSIALGDVKNIERYVHTNENFKKVKKLLPGPVTFIMKKKDIPDFVTCGLDTVAVRVPDFKPLLRALSKISQPIITTSANISGNPAPTCAEEIDERILKSVDYFWNCGSTKYRNVSTIVDLINGKVIRDGAIKREIIEEMLSC